MLLFLLGALRAIVEMLGLCLLGQAFLYLLAGRNRARNPVYQLLSLVTRGPRRLCAGFMPSGSGKVSIAVVCFLILAFLWLGLAFLRKYH